MYGKNTPFESGVFVYKKGSFLLMRGSECMTALCGSETVIKCDKRIVLRGEIDMTCAVCLRALLATKTNAETIKNVGEILHALMEISRCEALEEICEFCGVFGLSEDELRNYSNFPEKYLGKKHFVPSCDITPEVCALNELRAQLRRCEREAVAVVCETDAEWAKSIAQALNRLSAAAYILMLKA